MANNEQFLLDRGVHGKVGAYQSGLWLMGGRIAVPAAPKSRRSSAVVDMGNYYNVTPIVTLGLYTANTNVLTLRMTGLSATGFTLNMLSSTLDGKAASAYMPHASYVNWLSFGYSFVPLGS